MKASSIKRRIWELDFFRGIALILMVYFHIIYDLTEFYGFPISYSSGFNYYAGKCSVILFIAISAISCSFSSSNLKRGLKLVCLALLITLSSHIYNPDYDIKFGIIHFLGVSIILYTLFSKLHSPILLGIGILVISLGHFTSSMAVNSNYLFPLGLTSRSFSSSDYYPLVPWFGLFLCGIALGKFFYNGKTSIFNFSIPDNLISKAGRNTLWIYILHQPVILLVLAGIKYFWK
jgi:uncharacterized membrane protein